MQKLGWKTMLKHFLVATNVVHCISWNPKGYSVDLYACTHDVETRQDIQCKLSIWVRLLAQSEIRAN